PFRVGYPAPQEGLGGEFREDSRPGPNGLPGSDPALTMTHLRALGVDRAILLPLGRGLWNDLDFSQAICAATNDWITAKWLDPSVDPDCMFLGSIRIDPRETEGAIREIE